MILRMWKARSTASQAGNLSILLMLAMCTIAAAQSGMNRAEALANNGQIDDHAAVKASSEILIAAPTEKVWRILVEIDEWPKWQPNITAAKITGPVNHGTEIRMDHWGHENQVALGCC